VVPTLIQTGYGEREGQAPRVPGLDKPLGTAVAGGIKHALVAGFLAKHYGGHETPGTQLGLPISTLTTQDHHHLVTAAFSEADHSDEVRAFLVAYYGNEKDGGSLFEPVRTVTSKERFGLVTIEGQQYRLSDIGMRMLAPRELYRAQGFPDSYRIDIEFNGKPLSKTAQVRMCGNSVCPDVAAAILRANVALPSSIQQVA
jgi:DNA (cytosine-5)-methyltransferase 1